METKQIYKSINAIQGALAKTGISKGRKNQQQGYAFRGIDDVYGALAPLLAEHNVCIFPRTTEHTVVERQSARGGILFYTTVRVEFDFVSSVDGSTHTCITYGEAMDSADKSTNKAMSAAYKYACLQTFCIPTEGDNDADATTHEVMGNKEPATHPDDWMTIGAFEYACNKATTMAELQNLVNSQRANPNISQLVEIAGKRKAQLSTPQTNQEALAALDLDME